MPTRTTIARLTDGSLWVHSPGPMGPDALSALDRLGPVGHIVAPNCFHHLHFASFRERYPDADAHIAAGLAEKRPDLANAKMLSPGSNPWPDDLDMIHLDGAKKCGEFVFHHRASRSLIVSDLVFNVTRPEGLMTHLVLGLTGTRGRLAQSRLWNGFVTDTAAFEKSLGHVLSLDFDRLIVGHGQIVAEGAKDALLGALRHRPAA